MADVNTSAADALTEAVQRYRRTRDAAVRAGQDVARQQGGGDAGQPAGTAPGTGQEGA